MRPKVSVIIASYNHERFIRQAVESVLHQTFQNFEILIADDGSTDGSREIIESFSDPRIKKFCFTKNREQHPRNFCLEQARGEFIAILNSDDVFHPAKLERQLAAFANNREVGAVFSWIRLINEAGNDYPAQNHPAQTWFREPNRTRAEWLRRFFESGNHLCHPTALIRKQVIDGVGRYNPLLAFASDYDLWIKVALRSDIHVVPETLLDMRLLDGEANASGRRPTIIRRSFFEIAKVLRNFVTDEAVEMLPDIFPEFRETIASLSSNAKRHWLAEKSLRMQQESHRLFGLDLSYELLSDPHTRAELINESGKTVLADFIHHTAHSNPLAAQGYITAQLFWPTDGTYHAKDSRDAIVTPCKLEKILFSDVPVKPGDRLRFDPMDQCGIFRLEKVVITEQATGRVLLEISLPQGSACLLTGPGTVPIPSNAESGSVYAALSTDPQILLPAIEAEFTGHVRVEVSLKLDEDWRALAPALQTSPLPHIEKVSMASKLRASLVSMFSNSNRAAISPRETHR